MELFNYQRKAVDKAIKAYENGQRSFNLFFEMGLGKTITSIEIIKQVKHNTILVICPKSLIEMWAREIAMNVPNAIRVSTPDCLYFDSGCTYYTNREKADGCMYYITNYENIRAYAQTLCPDICILDEVHKLKNPKSLTHKCIQRIIKPMFTLKLTGTPITRDYMDLYGILTCVGCKINMTPTQFHAKYVKIGGSVAIKRLMDSIEPFTVFAKLEDHIEMPGYEDIVIPVGISKVNAAKLENVCRSDKNALARIIEAQRITSSIYGEKSLALMQLVHDILEDGRKVVIFTKYDDEFEFFMSHYGKIAVGINGNTKDRDTPVYEFQNNKDIKIFIGNLQTASVGLTLTAASDCIFYSETYTWGDADQSKARIYRIGQKHPCRYYHLLVPGTIDEMIYVNLIEKTDLIENFKKAYGGD